MAIVNARVKTGTKAQFIITDNWLLVRYMLFGHYCINGRNTTLCG